MSKPGGLMTFVWCPNASNQLEASTPHIYKDWSALYAQLSVTPGPKQIIFDPGLMTEDDLDSGFAVFDLPAGTYNMGSTSWKVLSNNYYADPVVRFNETLITGVQTMSIDARVGHIGFVNNNTVASPFQPGRGTPTEYGAFMVMDNWQGFFGNVMPFGAAGAAGTVPFINVPDYGFLVWRMLGGGGEPNARFIEGTTPIVKLGLYAGCAITPVTGGIISGDNFIVDDGSTGFAICAHVKPPNHRGPFGNRFPVFELDALANFGGFLINTAPAAGGVHYAVDGYSEGGAEDTPLYNDVHMCYPTGAAVSLALPTAYRHEGQVIGIKDAEGAAATYNITATADGTETIDGAATVVISTNYGYVELISDGYNWLVK